MIKITEVENITNVGEEPVNGDMIRVHYSNGVVEEKIYTVYESPESLPEDSIRKITIGAFRRRFTLAEKIAMETSTDPVVNVLDKDLMSSTFVDLDYPITVEGMDYLVDSGILKEERKVEMLQDGTLEEKV